MRNSWLEFWFLSICYVFLDMYEFVHLNNLQNNIHFKTFHDPSLKSLARFWFSSPFLFIILWFYFWSSILSMITAFTVSEALASQYNRHYLTPRSCKYSCRVISFFTLTSIMIEWIEKEILFLKCCPTTKHLSPLLWSICPWLILNQSFERLRIF